jgi:hypothetical protein
MTCKLCGKPTKKMKNGKYAKFCNTTEARDYGNMHIKDNIVAVKICPTCKQEFNAYFKKQKYCCSDHSPGKIKKMLESEYLKYLCLVSLIDISRREITDNEKNMLHKNKKGYFCKYDPDIETLLKLEDI